MMKRNSATGQQGGRGWLLALVLGLLSCMVMGLVLVWSNIERMDTTYFINIQQNTVRERRALHGVHELGHVGPARGAAGAAVGEGGAGLLWSRPSS